MVIVVATNTVLLLQLTFYHLTYWAEGGRVGVEAKCGVQMVIFVLFLCGCAFINISFNLSRGWASMIS